MKTNFRNFISLGSAIGLLTMTSLLAACASEPKTRFGSEPQLASGAEGAAYAAEGFTFSKTMPIRAHSPYDFYFKTCSHDDGKAYYSKTSYDCSVIP